MYRPPYNRLDDDQQIRAVVAQRGAAELVSADESGRIDATLLPVRWIDDTVLVYFARANPHWGRLRDGQEVLLIVTDHQAYISPSWYAAKAEHGRVVPTWNYESIHLRGTIELFDDPERLHGVVTDLTEAHESDREDPWHVTDAPAKFIAGQLRGIVGAQITVTSVEGKAKFSQNRSDADIAGVETGLASGTLGEQQAADRMRGIRESGT